MVPMSLVQKPIEPVQVERITLKRDKTKHAHIEKYLQKMDGLPFLDICNRPKHSRQADLTGRSAVATLTICRHIVVSQNSEGLE